MLKDAPSWPQLAPRRLQDGFKMAPRWLQDCFNMAPRLLYGSHTTQSCAKEKRNISNTLHVLIFENMHLDETTFLSVLSICTHPPLRNGSQIDTFVSLLICIPIWMFTSVLLVWYQDGHHYRSWCPYRHAYQSWEIVVSPTRTNGRAVNAKRLE